MKYFELEKLAKIKLKNIFKKSKETRQFSGAGRDMVPIFKDGIEINRFMRAGNWKPVKKMKRTAVQGDRPLPGMNPLNKS